MREMVEQNPDLFEELKNLDGTNGSPVVKTGGDPHIPPRASDWDLKNEDARTVIRQAWREIESDLWGDTGYDLGDVLGEYVETYNTERGRMDENYDASGSEN